jgi:peptidoglycan/xylan/chitin deacetylase (PgdA/CDA1 family)/Flp pilus assembly protein TadD
MRSAGVRGIVGAVMRARIAYSLLALAAWLFAAGVFACPSCAAGGALQYLLSGLERLESGQLDLADALLAQAEDRGPDLCEVAVARAALQLARGQEEAARQALLAQTAGACAGPAHLGAADCFLLRGEFDLAQQHYAAAITSGVINEPAARAGRAYALCALGQYRQAEELARAVLKVEGNQPLALQTLSAAAFARGDLEGARSAIERSLEAANGRTTLVAGPAAALESPILRTDSAYYAAADWSERERWAMALPVTAPRRPPSVGDRGDVAILSPAAGERVKGVVPIKVRVPAAAHFLFLRIDGRLASVSNAPPFALTFDAAALGAGTHELAVEAYDSGGSLIGRAESVILTMPGASRTFAPAAERQLWGARERLERFLRPLPSPLSGHLLLGKILEATGDDAEAVAQREYVFCAEPGYPGARADLLWSYKRIGLLGVGDGDTVLERFRGGRGRIALTFDDGPHPSLTPRILDLLDRFNVKATFFLIGKQAELYPDLVAETYRRGHEMGNHSYSHANLTQMPRLQVEQELVKTRAIIREACGAAATLFRPPGGNYNDEVLAAAQTLGFRTVLWTATISSYRGRDGEATLNGMLRQTRDGGILLLHNGQDETVDVLALLLSALQRQGLTPTTVSDLLQGG